MGSTQIRQYEVVVPIPTLTFWEEGTLGGAKFIPDGDFDIDDLQVYLDRRNLSDEITSTCNLTTEQVTRCPMMILPYRLDEGTLLKRQRDYDERILRDALSRADAILDLIRIDACRLDNSETWIGSAGYLNTSGGTSLAILVLSDTSESCRFIARKTWDPIAFPLLPTEIYLPTLNSELEPLITESLAANSLGSRLKRLLRAFGEACTIASDDLRILSLLFAIDGALCPESASSNDLKQAVAIAQHGGSFAQAFASFSSFYKEVRNVLVHRGARYEQLTRNREEDFLYLQSVFHGILLHLIHRRHETFDVFWKWVRDVASRQS